MSQYVAVRALNHSAGLRVPGRAALATPTTLAASAAAGAGLTPATYYYKVTAIGDAGETLPSNEASVVIATPANEVQRIVVDATAGTYTLTFSGQTTAAIAFDALGTAVQSALVALSNVAPGDVAVVGDGPYDVTFGGVYADVNVPQMTANSASLTGNTHTATVTTTTGGVAVNEQASLTWDAVPNAVSYRIYRGTSAAAEDHYQISSTNSFTDAGAVGTVGTVPSASTAVGGLAQRALIPTDDVVVDLDDINARVALEHHRSIGQYIISASNATNGVTALTVNS